MKHERDPAEYREQLIIEIRHLRRSARYFDEGDESEGQRLALSIRKRRQAAGLLGVTSLYYPELLVELEATAARELRYPGPSCG